MAKTDEKKWNVIEGCPGCYLDKSTGKIRIVITLTRAWVDGGKTKNYETSASARWPEIGKVELRNERAAFQRKTADELDQQSPERQPPVVAAPMTLLQAVPKFIRQKYGTIVDADGKFLRGTKRGQDVAKLMEHWCNATDDAALPVFGARAMDAITSDAITTVLNEWKAARMKDWTRHHRRAALSHCYATINGKSGRNPVRDTDWSKPRDVDARGFDYVYVKQILAHVPDHVFQKRPNADGTPGGHGGINKSKVVMRITLSTGLLCAELSRIEPRHLNLQKRTLYTWRTKAGKIVGARTIDLIPEAFEAFTVFNDEQMYGHVPDDSVVNKSWKLAVVKANAEAIAKTGQPLPLPPNCRPTDLRHCYGSLVFERTGSKDATAEIIGHVPGSRQTSRYVQSAVTRVVKEATAKVAAMPL